MKPNRIVIYPKDVQQLTGRSPRYAQQLFRNMKRELGKQKHQLVTFDEFCEFTGISRAKVVRHLL